MLTVQDGGFGHQRIFGLLGLEKWTVEVLNSEDEVFFKKEFNYINKE